MPLKSIKCFTVIVNTLEYLTLHSQTIEILPLGAYVDQGCRWQGVCSAGWPGFPKGDVEQSHHLHMLPWDHYSI